MGVQFVQFFPALSRLPRGFSRFLSYCVTLLSCVVDNVNPAPICSVPIPPVFYPVPGCFSLLPRCCLCFLPPNSTETPQRLLSILYRYLLAWLPGPEHYPAPGL
jgi:hypothetical protein